MRQAEPPRLPGEGALSPRMGVIEWLRPGEHERTLRMIEALRRMGIRHLRTGVSWADWHSRSGRSWYDWLLPRLAQDLEVVPCFTYTPPSLGIEPKTSSPPREPKAYADFLDVMITEHGRHFEWVEIWNEPNNLNDWDWRLDHAWMRFSEMAGAAAYWMKQRDKKTVLGGMCPTDPNWLALMAERGVLQYIDAIGLHAFPSTWDHHWLGWEKLVAEVRGVLEPRGLRPELWLSEVGYSTWRNDEGRQLDCFVDALGAPVDRVYWYAFQDLAPEAESQEGFHVDERHYHFGLMRSDGRPKLLGRLLERGGPSAVRSMRQLGAPARRARRRFLITGGAGFVGTNLADRLASRGEPVLIYDNLGRPGVEDNAAWLKARHGDMVALEMGDVRDFYGLREAVRSASRVAHLAAQVAVTTSVDDPASDFEINARGTFNLLEAVRACSQPPPLVFTSTNKVYGALRDLEFEGRERAYAPISSEIEAFGVGEDQSLDFHSPYGCSKGAADQYVLDYARIYGLPAVVFRMSCIYGPHQHGTEDQGWVAHFLRQALAGLPITIFGDGRQVRDLLYVEDLIDAFVLALDRSEELSGRAFNIGGGPANAASLQDVLGLIEQLAGARPKLAFAPWRPGDQVYYVSDVRRFAEAVGWRPQVGVQAGIPRLWHWLRSHARGPELERAEGAAA